MRPDIAAQWIMSVPDNAVRSLFTRYELFQPSTRANPYQSGRDLRKLIADEFWHGNWWRLMKARGLVAHHRALLHQ